MCALQELQILESLPFDKHVVEFHGSYSQDDNIYMVLEFMQVTHMHTYPLGAQVLHVQQYLATGSTNQPINYITCTLGSSEDPMYNF